MGGGDFHVTPPPTPEETLENQIDALQDIIDEADPALASTAADATSKVETAVEELTKTPPDNQGGIGNIEGAVGELEVALELLDPVEDPDEVAALTAAIDALVGAARQLAVDAIAEADAQMIDANVLMDAELALAEGDALRAGDPAMGIPPAFKDAVNKYKDALSKAESEL